MDDSANPFAGLVSSAPATELPKTDASNPFADLIQPGEDTSFLGAAGHALERGIAPALASIPAMGAGAELGSAGGFVVGGPVGAAIGGIGGGLAGAFAGSEAVAAAQNWALSQLPESWQDALGQSQKQQQAEAEKQPVGSFIGGLIPYALTMRPSFNFATRTLPENATAVQRLMANPLTAHLFGGAVTGGMELGSEAANKESPNWTKIGIATAFGTIFNTPTKIGEALTEVGARPARQLLGRPEPVAPAAAAIGPEAAKAPAEAAPPAAAAKPPGISEKEWNETLLGQKPPTVAQAGDAKVLGPGIDEAVFMGAHEQAPEALMTAQDAARTETATLYGPPAPNVATVARRMEPELFNAWDELVARRAAIEQWRQTMAEPEMIPRAAQAEAEMSALAPQIGAAYRRAADAVGGEVVEPPAPEPVQPTQPAPIGHVPAEGAPTEASRETQPVQPIAEQEAAIRTDITRQLIAAGRPEEEAQLLGHVGARRAITRAARLGNPNGALALYQQEGAIIRSGERRPPPTASAPPAPLMPTRERPNIAPEPVPTASEAPSSATEASNIGPKGASSDIESLDPNAIGVDAERFQFKSGGDEHGVTERLQDISKWDPRLAGTVLVFRDADGKDFVADGHQRLALAKRLMEGGHPPIRINAFVLDARDGITDETTRAIAAVKNIAEGTGTATDAAKVLREAKATGIELPQLPPRSQLVRDGRALAQLGPEAFGVVINEAVPANYGAIVGRLVQNPADQVEALRLLARFKPDNAQQAELIVRDMMETGTEVYRQQSLFGEEAFAGSVVLERAKIADEALKQLRRDKSTFRTLVDEAERIQGAGGNVLDQEANQGGLSTDERAAGFLKQLAFRAGPVSDALSDVARKLKSGEIKVGEAARTFLGDVRGAVENGVATGDHAGGAERGAEGEPGLEGPTFFQRGEISPNELTFREMDQNRLDQVRSIYPEGEGYDPIVTISRDGEHVILDGHNRASVARERGDRVPYVEISDQDYMAMRGAGFDDIEIAYAALSEAGEDEAASSINRQFPGARVAERGTKAQSMLDHPSEFFQSRKPEPWREGEMFGGLETERGLEGLPQTLIPGVKPLTDAERIAVEAARPLKGGAAPSKPGSLFDEQGREDAERQGTLFQPAPAPNTPEFNHWFGDSKVVDEHGAPLVVYHGTQGDIEAFAPDKIGSRFDNSHGYYFAASPVRASAYADRHNVAVNWDPDHPFAKPVQEGANIVPAYLSIKNPKVIRHSNVVGESVLDTDAGAVVKQAKAEGHDGVIAISDRNGDYVAVAFDPTQIKSVNNRGTFDPADPRILYQRGSKFGSIDMDQAGHYRVIKLFRDADASTFLHESGHQWLDEVLRDAIHPQATDPLKADAATVRKWLGMKDDQALPTTRQHERWARATEQFFREGVAPSKELAGAFAKFRTWLLDIYNTLRGLGAPISEDVRGVFDRLIEVEPNRTVVAPEGERAPTLTDMHEHEAATIEPHEAEPAMDRIVADRDRAISELPPEVQNELVTAEAQEQAAAGVEPAGQGDAGAGEPSALGNAGREPQSEPAGAPRGGEPGALERGGAGTGTQGAGVQPSGGEPGLRGERPGAAGAAGAQSLAPTPRTVLGPRESPFVDKAGNIRIENLTSDQDVAQAIRDAAQENNDFIGDRRGVITDGQVLDLADALGMDASKLNQRKLGEAFNAEQVVAARKLLIQSATDVRDIMARAAAPIATDEDVLAYAHAKARHQMIQAQVAGITAEAGRALRAFRSLAGDAQAMGMDQFLRSATGKTLFQLKEEAKLGAQLDTPMKVSKFVRDAQKRTFGSMVLEYWVNGLISGPATHSTYMVGNTILSLHKAGPETLTAALIGNAARALGRQGEVVHFGEAVAKLRGAHLGIPAATKAAIDALKSGVTTRLPGETPRVLPFQPGSELARSVGIDESVRYSDAMPALYGAVQGIQDGIVSLGALLKAGGVQGAPLVGLRYSPLGAIPDIAVRGVDVLPLGTVARLPSRAIAAIHSFFRTVNYSMEKNALAYRSAVDSGKTGTAFDAHVANLRQNPTADMMESAVGEATQATLMGKGSEFVQALGKLTNVKILGFPFLKFVDPFVHIAGNIIDQSIVQRTPLGILAPEIRADLMGKNGTIAQDTAAARMLVGTALSIGFGSLAAQGLMSGSGPSDPREATIWRMAGNQAHSVRIGDTWYDIHRLGPIGMLASVAADMYDVAHGASEGDMGKVGASLLQAFTHTMLDEGFGRGPADLIQALTDSQRYGPAYVRNQISSFVPFSVGMGQIARAMDPYSRQARSIMDAIKAKVPGLSQTLLPRRDIWGQALPSTEVFGQPGLSAIYTTQVNNDPVNHALLNLGIYPAQVDHKIRGVALTDEQFDQYATLAGGMAKQQLDKIVGSSQFSQWPAQTQHDVIEATIGQSREVARNMLMARFPQIAADALRGKLAQLQPAGE